MIPQTVPNNPMNGVMLATVARNGTWCSSFASSTVVRAQQRAVDGIEASQGWTSGGSRRLCRVARGRLTHLRIQLGVAGLEETDERALLERRTDGLHFRELAALAEDVEEDRRVPRRAAVLHDLVERDPPADRREEKQDEKDAQSTAMNRCRESAGRCRCSNPLRRTQHPAAPLAQRAQRRRLACANSPPRLRTIIKRRWDSVSTARLTRRLYAVKHLIRWNFASRLHAALSLHPPPGRHRSDRAGVRSWLNSVNWRDRRRQVDPDGSGRTARRRPRVGRARAHGRRVTPRSKPCSTHRTAAKSSSAGKSPRRDAAARSSTARSSRAARCASSRARSSTCTDSTNIRCCSIPRPTSTCSTRTRASRRNALQVAEAFSAWQKVRTERDRLIASQRESASRAEFVAFQLAEIDRVAPEARRRRRARRDAPGPRQRRQAAALCADAYQTLYEGDQAALASLGVVWRKVGSSRRSTNASRRTSQRATR